jgi:hypothetical protein
MIRALMIGRWIGFRERAAWEPRLTAAIVAACCGVLLYRIREYEVPICDDAAISMAYGRTIWWGDGFRITPYSQITEAYSNPLWTLMLGLPVALGVDHQTVGHVLGIGTAVIALPIVVAWGPALGDRPLRIEDSLPAVLASCSTPYVYWAAAGLEGPLLTLMIALAGLFTMREAKSGVPRVAGVFLGLVTLVRPEGVLYAAAIAIPTLIWRRRIGRAELITAAVALGIAGGGYVFRWIEFASLFPNPFYVKHLQFDQHGTYLSTFAQAHVAVVAFLGAAILSGPFVIRDRGARLVASIAMLVTLAAVALVIDAGGDWMREWRFLGPVLPIALLLPAAATSGMRHLGLWRPRVERERRSRRFWGAAFVCVLLAGAHVGQTMQAAERLADIRETPTYPAWIPIWFWERAIHRMESLGLRHPRVGIGDIGGVSLVYPEIQMVDLAGLADWTIARASRHDQAQVEDYFLHEVPPTLVDTHGPSGYLGGLPILASSYEPVELYESRYHNFHWVRMIRGLTPTEDPRCPGGLAEVESFVGDALADAIDAHIEADEPEIALRVYRCAREHRDDDRMPSRARLAASSDRALVARARHEHAGEIEPALRFSSLATVLADDDAHLRRETEALRARLIPPTHVEWLERGE